jgi:hypothetical protein
MKPEKKSEIESASPPNPAKENDRRFAEYRRKFGNKCWELDALSPTYLVDLVTKHVETLIEEPALWQERLDKITEERARLADLAEEWAA